MKPRSYDIPKALVWEACQRVKANGGAPGVDHETIEKFEERLGDKLYKLWNRMCSGSYFPPPVRAVPIPKKTGGVRVWLKPQLYDHLRHAIGYRRHALPTPTAIDRNDRRTTRSPSPDAGVGIMIGSSSSTSKVCSTTSITNS